MELCTTQEAQLVECLDAFGRGSAADATAGGVDRDVRSAAPRALGTRRLSAHNRPSACQAKGSEPRGRHPSATRVRGWLPATDGPRQFGDGRRHRTQALPRRRPPATVRKRLTSRGPPARTSPGPATARQRVTSRRPGASHDSSEAGFVVVACQRRPWNWPRILVAGRRCRRRHRDRGAAPHLRQGPPPSWFRARTSAVTRPTSNHCHSTGSFARSPVVQRTRTLPRHPLVDLDVIADSCAPQTRAAKRAATTRAASGERVDTAG